jgi:hypothetical protein
MRSLISFFRLCVPFLITVFFSTSAFAFDEFDEPVPSITSFSPPCGHYPVVKRHHVKCHHRHVKKPKRHRLHKKIYREEECCPEPCDPCMVPTPTYRCVTDYSYRCGRNSAIVQICNECY